MKNSEVIVTKSGARVKIVRDDHGAWAVVRDDGLVGYRARMLTEVDAYVRKFGDVLQPSPTDRPRIF